MLSRIEAKEKEILRYVKEFKRSGLRKAIQAETNGLNLAFASWNLTYATTMILVCFHLICSIFV